MPTGYRPCHGNYVCKQAKSTASDLQIFEWSLDTLFEVQFQNISCWENASTCFDLGCLRVPLAVLPFELWKNVSDLILVHAFWNSSQHLISDAKQRNSPNIWQQWLCKSSERASKKERERDIQTASVLPKICRWDVRRDAKSKLTTE